jgi:hypothetical protein
MAGVAAVPVTALAQLSAAQELAAERPKTLDRAPLASARGMRTEKSCILVLKEGTD